MRMQNQLSGAILFKEDVKYFLLNWKDTDENKNDWWKQLITEEQKCIWPLSKKLTQDLLGRTSDSQNLPLTIIHPKSNDTEAVGSCTTSQAKKYFEDNENMRWPCSEDVIRLGVFFHWGYYRTINMLLKVSWEKNLKAKAYGLMKYDQGEGLTDFLKNSTKAIEQFSLTFYDDVCDKETLEGWYHSLEKYAYDEFEYDKFSLLVQEYCNSKLFLRSVNDLVWDAFIADKEQEKKQATEEYWNHKTIWAAREGELEQVIFEYGQAKLNYRLLSNKWYKHFGDIYLKAKNLLLTNKVLQNRILLKKERPDITTEQMLEEELVHFESLKHEYKKDCALTEEGKQFEEPQMVEVSQQFVNDYHQACKKLLKRIWRLTHPDSYQMEGFTDKQIEILDEKFESSLEINERIALKGSDDFDLLELQNLLSEVENIWNTIGKDILDYDAVIGETPEDKIEWLKKRIQFLIKQIDQMHLRVKAVESNTDYLEKNESLANNNNIEQTQRAFEARIKSFQQLNNELLKQCKKMEIDTEFEL